MCLPWAQEQFLDGKVLIFKKRRRKNSRRLNGHRQVSRVAGEGQSMGRMIDMPKQCIVHLPLSATCAAQPLTTLRILEIVRPGAQ